MFCSNCVNQLDPNAEVCLKCGVMINKAKTNSKVDKPSTGLNIVSFLWPFVGLILYLVMKDQTPIKAKKCGKWALIGVGVSVAIAIIYFIIAVIIMSSTVGSTIYY